MLGFGFLHPGTAGLRDTPPLAVNDAPYPAGLGTGALADKQKKQGRVATYISPGNEPAFYGFQQEPYPPVLINGFQNHAGTGVNLLWPAIVFTQ